jgi:hypothetical protein
MIATLRLRESFDRSLTHGGFTIPDRTQPFDGRLLPDRFCHVSNNDHGLKRVLFDIDRASDFTLDGNGARLDFLGEILPIRVGRSRNVTIKNLTINWIRPFFSQAVLTDSGEGWVEIAADPELYPLRSDRGRLVAHDRREWQTDQLWNMLPFDPATGRVAAKVENWHLSRWHRASDLCGGRFRIEAGFAQQSVTGLTPGAPVVLMHGSRAAPGIWIEESDGVHLENVTVHHAPGMALIGQLASDISLDRVSVIPSDGRLFSSWVDAFHFVDCDGTTSLSQCAARGQFDDAVNIHGTFFRVLEKIGSHGLRLQTVHPQRFGKNPAIPGTGLALCLRNSMQRILVTKVRTATPLNQEVCDIEINDPITVLPDGSLIASRHNPDNSVRISGCTFGPNRGRGCLLNTEHDTVIEDCHFSVSGTAIECVPDANYWWEGPPAEDVTIRNNTFDNCGSGPCGSTLLRAHPEFPDGSTPRAGALRDAPTSTAPPGQSHPVLGHIALINNSIHHPAGRILDARNCQGLSVSGNRFSPTTRPILL